MNDYDAGFAAGVREANYREAYDNAGPDDVAVWFTAPASVNNRAVLDYERGFVDGWADHFEDADAGAQA
ncbi:hypothetical protein [Rhodococcus sp. NPDC058514]|uniref:hypothetical protein n=1 Tax=unclassified Rhodococcus (in: high G+C Gram-positive bacteria) TaxID=192944 RepID=UPI00365750BE